MIVGLGVDVVRLDRVDEKMAKKILTDRELEEFGRLKGARKVEYIAGRFALKEAFFKAVGTGIDGFSFKDVEFLWDDFGRPKLRIMRDFPVVFNFVHMSLSHDFVVVALVVLEKVFGKVFVKGEVPESMIISVKGDLYEIDSSYGPYRTMRELPEGVRLVKYGNVWEEIE